MNNGDLISRSALLEAFGEEPLVWDDRDYAEIQQHNDWLDYTKLVKEAPAVDAVEVVRCKDCKAWNTKTAMSYLRDGVHVRCCTCSACGRLMHDDDFCNYGERRGEA